MQTPRCYKLISRKFLQDLHKKKKNPHKQCQNAVHVGRYGRNSFFADASMAT